MAPLGILPNMRPLCNPPATVSNLFKNDLEFGCFRRFSVELARELTGYRKSEFWDRVVLQASEIEPCIRHAVVAIGALDFKKMGMEGGGAQNLRRESQFLSVATNRSNPTASVELMEKNRLEFAYCEYARAISCLKKSITQKTIDIRTSLITSVLFTCFESYHGNSDGASAQVYAGIDIMRKITKRKTTSKAKPYTRTSLPFDIDIVETILSLEIQDLSWGDKRRLCVVAIFTSKGCESAKLLLKTFRQSSNH